MQNFANRIRALQTLSHAQRYLETRGPPQRWRRQLIRCCAWRADAL